MSLLLKTLQKQKLACAIIDGDSALELQTFQMQKSQRSPKSQHHVAVADIVNVVVFALQC